MLVEILVLGREEGRLDQVGDRLDRQVEPALARVLGDQLAVGGVDAVITGGSYLASTS